MRWFRRKKAPPKLTLTGRPTTIIMTNEEAFAVAELRKLQVDTPRWYAEYLAAMEKAAREAEEEGRQG